MNVHITILFYIIVLITKITATEIDELKFAAPSASPSANNATNVTVAPTVSGAPTMKNAPSASPSRTPSGSPTISNKPTTLSQPSQHPSSTPSIHNVSTPQPTGAPTAKPTKQYTSPPSPEPDSKPSKKHSKIQQFFKGLLWFIFFAACLIALRKCFIHRDQVFHFLGQVCHKLKVLSIVAMGGIGDGCVRVGQAIRGLELGRRAGEVVGGIRAWIEGRRRAPAVDEDGSTMMQGLLLRENL